MPLKSNLKKLPTKKEKQASSDTRKAASTIKKTVQNKKSTSGSNSRYGNSTKGRGTTTSERNKIKQGTKTVKEEAKKLVKNEGNKNANPYKTTRKQYQSDGSIHYGGNKERHLAYSDPTLGMHREQVYANNAGARFMGNMAESLIDNSALAVPYTLATGTKPSQSDFLSSPIYNENPDWQSTANNLREQSRQGIAAGAGRMAGMAINYGMARSALNPALDKAANAVMNGTRLGEAIGNSAKLGKIGQSLGTKLSQDIGKGLVKETISDATLGFGQNALLNYGEGLRGEDFWKQQAKDTALDFLVGGAMEGVGIGNQIRGLNKATQALIDENPASMLNKSISKEDYLADLWERMNARMSTHNDVGEATKLRDAAYNKIDDLVAEYNKVLDMSPKQFNRYKLGRDLDENVKYYDATRGRTVKNAYEGDLETVRNTPVEQREKFGNRPKEGEEATTVNAETPETKVVNSVDETVATGEKTASTPEVDKSTAIKESQDEMAKIYDAINRGDLEDARKRMDDLDKRLKEAENSKATPEAKPVEEKPAPQKAETKTKGKSKKSTKAKTKKNTEAKENPNTTSVESSSKAGKTITEDGGYKVGDKVIHQNFGKGEVVGFEEFTRNKKKYRNAVIRFEDGTENVISHTNATETGFLKHADAETDAVAKAEKEAVAETPAETLAKKEPTAEAETPKKTKAESTMRTALVYYGDEKNSHTIIRRDGYKSQREFEAELRNNGYKVSHSWSGDKTDEYVNEWHLQNRNPKSDQLPKADRKKTPAEKALENRAEKEAVSEQKIETSNEKNTLPTEKEVKEATNPETTSRDAVGKLTNAQLESMCKDYEINVTPTGKRGKPVKQDYVDAISKHFGKEEEALNTAISKAKETPAPQETKAAKKTIPSKEIGSPDDIKIGSYIVDDRYGVGKIVGFEDNKYVGKIAKAEFSDDSFGIAVDKAGSHWKMYAGDDTPELGVMHKTDNTTTVSGDAVSTTTASGGSTTTLSGEGTETFTISSDIPNTPPKKRPLKQLRKNRNTELPKGEKVEAEGKTPKSKKPLSSNSSYQDIAEHFGDSETTKRLREVEEFISKWEGKDTAKAMETYLRSDKINSETKKIIMEMRENGEAFTKEVVTNKSVLEEAERRVKDDFDGTVAALFSKVKSGEQFTSQDMANASQISKKYMEQGDFRKAAEIQGELSTALSETGRFLQSQRYWRSLTPEGRVSAVVSSMRKLEKSRGMKKGTIRVGEEGDKLLKAIYEAKTNKELAEANKAFATYVWNQVPRTFAEKANAWRYLAMLGNPKTHIRNVLGNALFMPARKISDAFATAFEKAYSKKLTEFGGEATRRHAIINHFSAEDRALLKKAGENFKDDRDLLESISSKMFERQRAEGSSVFKTKYLDFLEKFNTKALNQEDVAFMALNYKSAYAQFCKSNGVKASDITEEFAKKASEYAQDQALKATYRDSNALADALNKMRKNLIPKKSDDSLMKVGKRAGGFLMDSTIPFVKTPLNILKRGTLEYSPVGIARGIGRIAGASDANSLLKGIEYLSNGLTGTGVLALGMFLANRGVVNGSLGEWGKDKAYSQMLGEQDYSVNVGDKTITLDWVAPMSMPFFVGVEAATAMADGINGTEILESMSNISDPIFEMSMLQGIENNFNMAFSDKKGLGTIAKNAGFNYLSQFVPTLAGQIARTRVRDRKTVLSTSTDPFVQTLEKNFGKILNKVPIAGDVLNQDYVDLWGRTDSKESAKDYVESGFENLLSPAYISKRNETAVDKEIKDLYSKLGEEDKEKILPTFATNAFKQKLDDKEYNMTPAEFTQYKKTVGQARYKGLEELFKTSTYKNASNDEKRKMIESVYDDANNAGKKEYLTKVDKDFASAPDFYMLDEKQREKYDDSLNMSKQDWAKAYTAVTKVNNDVYKESGLNLSNTERALVLAENGVTSLEQAKTIYKNISESAWDRGYTAHKLGKTVEDVQEEAIARENMTETERKFDSNFRSRSEIRYMSSKNAPIDNDLYDRYLKVVQNVDKSNDDNGVIKQAEAQSAIEYINRTLGLTDAQKAYLWHLSENDEGWKKQPYGKWKG